MDSGVCIIGKTPPQALLPDPLGGGVNTLAKPYQRPCMCVTFVLYRSAGQLSRISQRAALAGCWQQDNINFNWQFLVPVVCSPTITNIYLTRVLGGFFFWGGTSSLYLHAIRSRPKVYAHTYDLPTLFLINLWLKWCFNKNLSGPH